MTSEQTPLKTGLTITALALVILAGVVTTVSGGAAATSQNSISNPQNPKSAGFVGEAAVTSNGYIIVRHVQGTNPNLRNLKIKVNIHKQDGSTISGSINQLPLQDQRVPSSKTAGSLDLNQRWGAVSATATQLQLDSGSSLVFMTNQSLTTKDTATITLIRKKSGTVISTYTVNVRNSVPMKLPNPDTFWKVSQFNPPTQYTNTGTKTKYSHSSPGSSWTRQNIDHYRQVRTGTATQTAAQNPGYSWTRTGVDHYQTIQTGTTSTTSESSPGPAWSQGTVVRTQRQLVSHRRISSATNPGPGWSRAGFDTMARVVTRWRSTQSHNSPGSGWSRGRKVGTTRMQTGTTGFSRWVDSLRQVRHMPGAHYVGVSKRKKVRTGWNTIYCGLNLQSCTANPGYKIKGKVMRRVGTKHLTTYESMSYPWKRGQKVRTTKTQTGTTTKIVTGWHTVTDTKYVQVQHTTQSWSSGYMTHWTTTSQSCHYVTMYHQTTSCHTVTHHHSRWVSGHYVTHTYYTWQKKQVQKQVWGPYQKTVPVYTTHTYYRWHKPVYKKQWKVLSPVYTTHYKVMYRKPVYSQVPVYKWTKPVYGHRAEYYWQKPVYGNVNVYRWSKPVYGQQPVYTWQKPTYSQQPIYKWTTSTYQSVHGPLVRNHHTNWTLVHGATISKNSKVVIQNTNLATSASNAFTVTAAGKYGSWSMKVYKSNGNMIVTQNGAVVWKGSANRVTINPVKNRITTNSGTTSHVSFGLGTDIKNKIGVWNLRVTNGASAQGTISITSDGS